MRPRPRTVLEYLRRRAQLTQAEVARLSGLHRSTISQIESGRFLASRRQLVRLADVVGLPAAESFHLLEVHEEVTAAPPTLTHETHEESA